MECEIDLSICGVKKPQILLSIYNVTVMFLLQTFRLSDSSYIAILLQDRHRWRER